MKAFRPSLLSSLLPFLLSTPISASYPQNSKNLAWTLTPISSNQQFRGLSPISASTVWVSGTNGTVLLTTNSGTTWHDVSPTFPSENSTSFQFRDIHAFSARAAVVLSIGEANASRIYLTTNAGKSWTRTFLNDELSAFYDCLAFEKERGRENHGIALSDPVNGHFRLLESWDYGQSWKLLANNATLPTALTGEFAFAASGTCVEAAAGRWYIATGGVDPGRIFRTSDPRRRWKVSNSSITGGAAAGVFSVRFRDDWNGIAVGGDYETPAGNMDVASWSQDRGVSWVKAKSFPGGYRSGVSWVPGRRETAVAVGTSGSDISYDGGKSWVGIGNGTFDAVECVGRSVCWASGSKGRVGKLVL